MRSTFSRISRLNVGPLHRRLQRQRPCRRSIVGQAGDVALDALGVGQLDLDPLRDVHQPAEVRPRPPACDGSNRVMERWSDA